MRGLADIVMGVHLAWIGWVVVGALFTRGRPWRTAFHVGSLAWGIIVNLGPWPCPLTMLENWLDVQAGTPGFSGGFVAHYLGAVLYPNAPAWIVIWCGVAVCCVNLLIYGYRLARWGQRRRMAPANASGNAPKVQ